MRHIGNKLFLAIALFGAVACGNDASVQTSEGDVDASWVPADVDEIRNIPIAEVRAELDRQLKTKPSYATDDHWRHVQRLYQTFGGRPLWLDERGYDKERVDVLVDALVNATTDGIRIDEYPLEPLVGAMDRLRHRKETSADKLVHADLLLTTAYVALAEDYLTGQVDPKTVAQSWHIDTKEEEVDSALVLSLRFATLSDAFDRMRPHGNDYGMLREKLAEYRKLVSAGGWQPVPAGKALKRGDTDSPARLAALRARLQAEGITVAGDTTGKVFDESFAAGVAQFQARHGIVVDSTLGAETLTALNVPATFRLAQIAANLERYRWLPRTLGSRYIFVNVPAFRLEGYEAGRKSIEMKVIVGAEYDDRATPVFSDHMEFVVFRPYWNVTDDIANNELFPKFSQTGVPPDYEIYSDNGVQRIRQKPGAKNSLGLVKFMFPNDFNIYLHDTPQDNLFQQDIRAFSHGCIRVEKPEELAQWVLGWDRGKVEAAMHGSDNRHVKLPEKIPVYIAYMTTYVRDGQLWFGNDLYRRDAELAQAVWGGAMPSAEAVRTVAALRKLTD